MIRRIGNSLRTLYFYKHSFAIKSIKWAKRGGGERRNVRETMTHDPRWINPRPKKNPSSLRSRNPLRSGNQNICPRAIDFRRGEKKKGEILLSRVKKKKRGEASSTTRVERSNCRNNRHPVFVK